MKRALKSDRNYNYKKKTAQTTNKPQVHLITQLLHTRYQGRWSWIRRPNRTSPQATLRLGTGTAIDYTPKVKEATRTHYCNTDKTGARTLLRVEILFTAMSTKTLSSPLNVCASDKHDPAAFPVHGLHYHRRCECSPPNRWVRNQHFVSRRWKLPKTVVLQRELHQISRLYNRHEEWLWPFISFRQQYFGYIMTRLNNENINL